MAKKFKTRLGLQIVAETKNEGYGYSYFHVIGHPVTIGRDAYEQAHPDAFANVTDDTVRGCRDQRTNGLYLHDLTVYSQGDDSTRADGRLYGLECRYSPYSVDLQTAKAMADTLTTIDRRLAKIAEAFGSTNDTAEYFARVANAIGADCMVWKGKHGDNKIVSIADGVYHVRSLIFAWRESAAA